MKFTLSDSANIYYHEKYVSATTISLQIKRLAKQILEVCPQRNKRVLIFLEHNPSALYSIFAVLSLGMTYIPINPSLPLSRVNYIKNDSEAGIVITSAEFEGVFNDIPVVYVDHNDTQIISTAAIEPVEVEQDKIAYIIYTSGTTGVPKGVVISYGAITNFIEGFSSRVSLRVDDRLACISNIGFDIFFVESVYALLKGISIVVADQNESSNPKMLAQLVTKNRISVLQITPSRLELLCEFDHTFSCLSTIRLLLVGGESFPLNLLQSLQRHTHAQIFNLYGPTEATIWTTVADLTHSSIIHIGYPIKDMSVYIVDEKSKQVLPNQIGEIVISGPGLAQGYLNNAMLTNQMFIQLMFLHGAKAYKTGDYGKFDKNGLLYCNGRLDNQIKIHGYRIEPEEIEAVMKMVDGVIESLVVYDSILKAYYVGPEISLQRWRLFLSSKLPEYMIPSIFIRLNHFEYTINGKLDRKYPYNENSIERPSPLNVHLNEEKPDLVDDSIIAIIKQCVGFNTSEKLDPKLKLDELGMDSYGFIRAVVSIEERFGIEFEDQVLSFHHFPDTLSFIDYVKNHLPDK